MLLSRRFHLFEINDQDWWPQPLREKVQDCLTLLWITRQPIVTPTAPASLAAQTLSRTLGPHVSDYVYVDFASGAGGPTAYIERRLNMHLKDEVDFVLTDLKPHISAWDALAKKSDHLSYVRQPVDAANAPTAETLLKDVKARKGKKVIRLFSLAFHHFDDELAEKILRNTVETSDAFCIFELQSRHLSSFITVTLLWPLLLLSSWFHFFHSPLHLIFTYLIPLVPFVVVFDGYISSIRTRTPEEVETLLKKSVGEERLRREGWTLTSGSEMHTWQIGWLNWIVCTRNGAKD